MRRLWEYRYILRYSLARLIFIGHGLMAYMRVTSKFVLQKTIGLNRPRPIGTDPVDHGQCHLFCCSSVAGHGQCRF